MNDNYLWDRTGEADRDVQKLEEVLGTLRYQPQPLKIPSDVMLTKRRPLISLAIAAAIALVVLAAGLWLRVSRLRTPAPSLQVKSESQTAPKDVPTIPVNSPKENVSSGVKHTGVPRRKRSELAFVAINKQRRARPFESGQPQLTAEELAQKQQLVMALRIVSVKLNLAQRKTQGPPPSNIIRNQHKVG